MHIEHFYILRAELVTTLYYLILSCRIQWANSQITSKKWKPIYIEMYIIQSSVVNLKGI